MLALLTFALAADTGYQQPPDTVATILDAQYPPRVSISPDNAWLVELDRPALRTLNDLAEPEVKVAGLKLNPDTFGPAREYALRGMRIGSLKKSKRTPVDIPENARIRNVDWNDASSHFSWTNTTPEGIELWVTEAATAKSSRVLEPVLNAVTGRSCDWLPDNTLVCKVVPDTLGSAPLPQAVPTGPKIDESLGRKTPARTYTNLLGSAHDEALFEHYLQSELVHLTLDGSRTLLRKAAMIGSVSPSPDGAWILVSTYHPPWSYHVPLSRFPVESEVFTLADPSNAIEVRDLSLADAVPIPFGSVRTGRRSVGWRSDSPATLWFVEALDDGDAGKEAEERDRISLWPAPFEADPTPLWTTQIRFNSITWGAGDLALGYEYWYDTRELRTWRLKPDGGEPTLIWTRSYQDRYSDPGDPILKPGPHGRFVIHRNAKGEVLFDAPGHSPKGPYPRLDAIDLDTKAVRTLWKARDPFHETLVDILDDEGVGLLTRRQSKTEPPNYFRRVGSRAKPVTRFEDWAPAFAKVNKKVITYERNDGVQLTATVYTPPGWTKSQGPLPTIFWAYPQEFKSKGDAGQVTRTEKRFSRPGGSSHLFFLLHGYAVVDNPTMPIVGEGDQEPNDTYVEQLVAGAEAAVKMAVDQGFSDPERLVIGGHSYGAFTTANLLAHTDLFAAGIARSGAYNRSLTPFGFQSEQRTYWDKRDTYITMSPFTHAPKIDEPILLIHGQNDPNPGTYPMQSERMFEALKGNGATVRWVELPLEEHGYRARESIGHTIWEMFRWADTYAVPDTPEDSPEP